MLAKLKITSFLMLLVAHGLCFGQPPIPCAAAFERLTHLIQSNSFEVQRDFAQYAELFPQSFLTEISRLNSHAHWLDAGSGEGFAIEDMYNQTVFHAETFLRNAESSYWKPRRIILNPKEIEDVAIALNLKSSTDKPKSTGVSFMMKREAPEIPGVEFKTGRFFEDIPNSEFPKTDIITDLYGVVSYSSRVDEVLRKYHSVLKQEGKAYIFIGDYVQVPPLSGILSNTRLGNAGWYAPFETSEVRLRNGKTLSLLDWVMTLKGFRAQLEFREIKQSTRSSHTPGLVRRSTIVLGKTSEQADIPYLRLIETNQGKPPVRIFEEVEP